MIVGTLVQGIYDDDARNVGGGEGVDDQNLELRHERVLCHGRVLFDNPNDMASERGVPTCELVRDCGEDVPELLSFEVIPGAEEARAEVDGFTLCNRFGECLGDGRFSCSGQPVEPEDVSVLLIFGPAHYPIKDGLPSPAKTGIVVTSLVSCVVYGAQLFKQIEVCGFLVIASVSNCAGANLKIYSR